MIWGLFVFSLAASVGQGTLMNHYSKRRMKTGGDLYLYNLVAGIVASIAMFIYGGIPKFSTYTLVLGIVYGIVSNLGAVFRLLALRSGTMCYTLLIITMQMMIPALSGAVIWDEPISMLKIAGALLMLVSMAMSFDYRVKEKQATWRWFLYCMIALLCYGAVGVMQKMLGYSDYSHEQNGFLLVAMVVSALFALANFLHSCFVKKEMPSQNVLSKMVPTAALSGVCLIICNVVNLYLAGVMPSILFFPLFNGSSLLLSAAVAFLVFRERLNKMQTIGFAVGIAAALMLCIG